MQGVGCRVWGAGCMVLEQQQPDLELDPRLPGLGPGTGRGGLGLWAGRGVPRLGAGGPRLGSNAQARFGRLGAGRARLGTIG